METDGRTGVALYAFFTIHECGGGGGGGDGGHKKNKTFAVVVMIAIKASSCASLS